MVGNGEEQARLFPVMLTDKVRAESETHKILSEHKKILFYCKCDQTSSQIARDVMDFLSMEIFKTRLDMILLQVTLLEQGDWSGISKSLFQPQSFCDSVNCEDLFFFCFDLFFLFSHSLPPPGSV